MISTFFVLHTTAIEAANFCCQKTNHPVTCIINELQVLNSLHGHMHMLQYNTRGHLIRLCRMSQMLRQSSPQHPMWGQGEVVTSTAAAAATPKQSVVPRQGPTRRAAQQAPGRMQQHHNR